MFYFEPVKEVPGRNRGRKDMDAKLNGFMKLNTKAAEVVGWEDEYKNIRSAQSTLHNALKRRGLPVHVRIRNTKLYLVRDDM